MLGAGGVTNTNAGGWRDIYWMQAAFHLVTSLGLLCFYWPQRRSDFPKMSFKSVVWACDPIGSLLFIGSATLMLLALDWAGGAYPWSNTHVAVPLSLGCAMLVAFCLYGEFVKDRRHYLIVVDEDILPRRVERPLRRTCSACLL